MPPLRLFQFPVPSVAKIAGNTHRGGLILSAHITILPQPYRYHCDWPLKVTFDIMLARQLKLTQLQVRQLHLYQVSDLDILCN